MIKRIIMLIPLFCLLMSCGVKSESAVSSEVVVDNVYRNVWNYIDHTNGNLIINYDKVDGVEYYHTYKPYQYDVVYRNVLTCPTEDKSNFFYTYNDGTCLLVIYFEVEEY